MTAYSIASDTPLSQRRRRFGECAHGLVWCGECYELVRRGGLPASLYYVNLKRRAIKRRFGMGFVPRRESSPGVGSGRLDASSAFAAAHPALYAYLTCGQFEDGSERLTSSMSIFCQEGVLKVCLRDPSHRRICFVAGDSFEGVLEALEARLADGGADWRPDRSQPTSRRR